MKKYLDGILVVEGKEDASYLSNYFDSEIVTVQGYELAESTISYLKDKKVIAVLDPDDAGKNIREKLNKLLPNVINVEINIEKCTRGYKNGVAECEISEIMAKLQPYIIEKPCKTQLLATYTLYDLYELGIADNSQLRIYVCKKLSLGNCNNKQLLKRLNSSNVELDSLKKIIEEYKHGN